jgi:hypothetical protein
MLSTAKLTNAQRGAYIQLMCLQATNGHVTEKDMMNTCAVICFDTMKITMDKEALSFVKSKFVETTPGSGHYRNPRLTTEIEKRTTYSESRRNNRMKKTSKTYDNTYDNTVNTHMVNVNANVNENENKGKGVQGENEKPTTYANRRKNIPASAAEVIEFFKNDSACMLNGESEYLGNRFYNNYASQGWLKKNKMPVTDWKAVARVWAQDHRSGVFKNTGTERATPKTYSYTEED